MKGAVDKSMAFTITAAAAIVAAAIVAVVLYRSGVVSAPDFRRPSEKRIARNLDFSDSRWPEELVELNLPSFQKDFAVYSAFSYSGDYSNLTLVYATRAKIGDIRAHYRQLLENPSAEGRNDDGVLNLKGLVRGRIATVTNYFSEVSNLIQVNMEMTGEYAAMIRQKVIDAFPRDALTAAPDIGAFASGESSEGYVMYDFNSFAEDIYPNVPLFSRAYSFAGTTEELKEKINSLGERYTDPARARISEGIAEIQHGGYLYQVKPLEDGGQVKVALIVQSIPEG
ncbi:MAG: hypothetical protein LBP69_04880 [Treponema sp.]|jgi:hypothetical protein|nr:hypothetical protein [Treponema sp.]